MGILSADIQITNANVAELGSMPLGPNNLLSLTLLVLDPIIISNSVWAQIGLLSGGTTIDQRALVLDEGPLGFLNAIHWTGFISPGDDAHAYALVSGLVGATLRISASVILRQISSSIGAPRVA